MKIKNNDISRRRFLLAGTALGLSSSLTDLAQGLALEDRVRSNPTAPKTLHIIGYSHIDAAWLWPWRDGSNIALTTFRSALDRMNETPDFRYCHSSMSHYKWVEHSYPEMFEEVRQRVKEGRFEVVGGWPVEPDCNIPSTESFVRHCLYGKEYAAQRLGVDVTIGLNPDSFGHAAGLPTILKGAGYRYYVFMRPQEHEMNLPQLFWWEGPDGSSILTLRIRSGYSRDADGIPDAAQTNFAPGFEHGAFFMGIGDHGGAVTKSQIQQVLEMQKDPSLPELRWSTLKQFFAAVEQSPAMANLPVIRTELQHHARGCYAAYGEGKQTNRRAERWLGQAETLSTITNVSYSGSYPAAEYKEAWWKVMFNQFHDMMAGTALYTDYQDVRDSLGWACETAQKSRIECLEVMAKRVDTRSMKEGGVFVFNPLPWARKAIMEFHADPGLDHNPIPITHLETKDKQKVQLQWRPADSMTFMKRMCAVLDVPACGYKVLELVHGIPPDPEPHSNLFTVSESGFGISSLRTQDDKELLASPVGLVVISDTSDTWSHSITTFRQEMGRPSLVSSTIVEDGPVLRVTRQRATWNNSAILLDILQYRGMDALELRFVIDWHEHEQILKLEVPISMAAPRVFAKVPGAAIERQTNGEEEPYQDWVAVQGKLGNKDYTVALVNDSTYSYDCLKGMLRTVIVRSAPFARHDPATVPHNNDLAWQDQGRQERRFWLVPGKGPYTDLGLDVMADELQTRAEYVIDSAHHGSEDWEKSFFEAFPRGVHVLSIKRAESGEGVTVRLQERTGVASEAKLTSMLWGLDHRVKLAAWQIKTLLMRLENGKLTKIEEVSLIER